MSAVLNESPVSDGKNPHDEFLNGLTNADAAIGAKESADPLNQAMADGKPVEVIPPTAGDNYFRQVMPSLIAGALDLSKRSGWTSPAVEPMLTEKDWIEQVSNASIHTLEKYVPNAASKFDSEIVLCSLVIPWFALNLYDTIQRKIREGKKPKAAKPDSGSPDTKTDRPGTTADLDLGLDRNRKDDMATAALGR